MADNDITVFCPLIDENIDGFNCMENQTVKDDAIPAKYKAKPDWKDICKNCKNRDY
jgi:hypothetical protein